MRRLLIATWFVFALLTLGLALLVVDVYNDSEQMRIARSLSELDAGCQAIRGGYLSGIEADQLSGGRSDHLDSVVRKALAPYSGVEGGIWSASSGFLAYGYPSYSGSVPKTDVPTAETPMIEALSRSIVDGHPKDSTQRSDERETVLVSACLLPAPPAGVSAWTLTRVHRNGEGFVRLNAALWALLAIAILAGSVLTWTFRKRAARFHDLELALAQFDVTAPVALAPINDRELMRVVSAVNGLAARLDDAHARAAALSQQVVASERLAALGRLSAVVAHEIRNPLASVRLKLENAQADGTPNAQLEAAAFVLSQVTRLEELVRQLLATTQPISLQTSSMAVEGWVREHLESIQTRASHRSVRFEQDGPSFQATFDPVQLGRALDNLLDNAIRFTPVNGIIRVAIQTDERDWTVRVIDPGPGVVSELKATLFEPFVTGRVDGNGLGLPIARDIVRAHGGDLALIDVPKGACFEIRMPWRAS